MRVLGLAVSLLCASSLLLAEPISEGTYKGKYEGSAGSSGDIRVTLAKAADGAWSGDVVFVLGGQDVKCKVSSVTVEGSKLKMVYSFDLQGNALESMIDGEFKEGRLAGKYRTQTPGDGSTVDEGTWTAASGT